MLAIIVVVLIAVVALAVFSFAVHFLFSPWLPAATAIAAWIKFRPRRFRWSPPAPGRRDQRHGARLSCWWRMGA